MRTMPIVANPSGAEDNAPHAVGAFFDVDNTLIRGASAFHLARALLRKGFFTPWDIVQFSFHNLRYLIFGESLSQVEEVRRRALEIVKGHSVAEMTGIGEEVWDQVLSLRIFPGTKAILDEHLAAGHQVWLITATPQEIGDLIAQRIGATGALGTVGETKDGFYTGELLGDMMHGAAKATAVQELATTHGLDLTRSYAYGDSVNDVPLLSIVGSPCAINPDSRLRRHAQDQLWPIREFRRRRKLAKRSFRTAGLAGLAWAANHMLKTMKRSRQHPGAGDLAHRD